MGGSTKVVPTTSNTQQTVQLPDYILQAGQAATQKAQDFAAKPYQGFSGETVAPLTGNQNNAIGMAASSTGAGTAANQSAMDAITGAGNVASSSANAGMGSADYAAALAKLAGSTANSSTGAGASDLTDARGYNAQSASPVTSDQINSYFNPYVQSALDPVIANLTRTSQQTGAGLASKAAMTGSFGGSRSTLQQSQNNADLLRQVSTTANQGYSDAYNTALAAAQQDKAREGTAANTSLNIGMGANTQANDALSRLTQAATSNETAGTTQSNLADASENRFLGIVNPANQTATTASQLSTDAINRLLTTGALQQTQQQNVDNANYQQYQNQQNWALTQLNALIAAAGGVPYGANTTSNTQGTQVVQSPSMLGQIAGAGVGIAGLMSDRDSKEDFNPVDDEDVLEKLKRINVETYRYKPEVQDRIGDDGRLRIGPMSQDWGREFSGNPEAKVIPMPELMGAMVSAIRALEKRTRAA